jgi:hypothetical protein
MARPATGVPIDVLKAFGLHLLKKMGCMALLWVAVYFISQLMAEGAATLFGMALGSVAGLVIGWVMAEDAVARASFTGLPLWVLLVAASWIPIWVVELLLKLITGWDMTFGRWMMITAALLLSMASAVWRASADD